MDKRLTWRDIKELCERILKGRMYTIIDPSLELDPIDSIWRPPICTLGTMHDTGVYIKFVPGVVIDKSGIKPLTITGIKIEENDTYGVIDDAPIIKTKISTTIDIIDTKLLGIISRMYYTLYPLYPEPKTTHIEIDEEEYTKHHDSMEKSQKETSVPDWQIPKDMFSDEQLKDSPKLDSVNIIHDDAVSEKHKIDLDNSRAKITTTRQILADDKISLLSTVIMETCITLIQENTREGYNTYAKTVKDTRERLNTILHEVFQEEVMPK